MKLQIKWEINRENTCARLDILTAFYRIYGGHSICNRVAMHRHLCLRTAHTHTHKPIRSHTDTSAHIAHSTSHWMVNKRSGYKYGMAKSSGQVKLIKPFCWKLNYFLPAQSQATTTTTIMWSGCYFGCYCCCCWCCCFVCVKSLCLVCWSERKTNKRKSSQPKRDCIDLESNEKSREANHWASQLRDSQATQQ